MNALAVGALVLVLAATQQPQPDNTGNSASNNQKQPAQTRAVGESKPAPQKTQQPHKQQAQANAATEKRERPKSFKEWMRGLWTHDERIDVATFVVNSLFLLFTILTWQQMRRANQIAKQANAENDASTQESLRLTRESNEQTRRAVVVAEDHAKAAAASVTVQERTLELQNRAWLVCASIDHEALNAGVQFGSITATIENVGRGVPANNVRVVLRVAHIADALPEDAWDGLAARDVSSVSIVGPGQTTRVTNVIGGFGLSVEADIRAGKLHLYAYGIAVYDDMFATGRALRYAGRYEPKQRTWVFTRSGNEIT